MATKHTKEQEEQKEESPEQSIPSDPLQEMTELLKRTQANFENYKKQNEKRMEEMSLWAAKDVIIEILPILDNFELALKQVPQNTHPDFVHGMELIYAQLFSLLENQGVTLMETSGKKFDPYLHEALMKVESEFPENAILEEFQKGYLLSGQVLRHAKVKLSAGMKNHVHENKPKNNNDTEGN